MRNCRQSFGFTLIETLVVVSIVAILAAIAVPSMRNTLERSSVRATQTDLVGAFNYARSEAVSRNKIVTVCASLNGTTCAGEDDWSTGWLVFVDDGTNGGVFGNGEIDGDEELLRAFEGSTSATIGLVNSVEDAMASISWNFRGFASARSFGDPADKIEEGAAAVVCVAGGNANTTRAVVVAPTGRVYRSVDSDGNGVHEKSFGGTAGTEDLSCS